MSRPVWLGEDTRRWDHIRVHLAVLADERLSTYHLAVYLVLVAHAEVSSGESRPSLASVAAEARVGRRKVDNVIADLESWSYLRIDHSAGRTANRYYLLPPPTAHLVRGSGNGNRAPHASQPRTPGQSNRAPGAREQEPRNKNPEQEPSSNGSRDSSQLALLGTPAASPLRSSDDEFDGWWKIYPRHEEKKAAKAKFAKVRRDGVPLEVLMVSAQRYRDDPNREARYTKHPAVWLNKGCWDDDPLPAVNGNGSRPVERQWWS